MTIGALITNYQAWPTTLATLEALSALHPNDSDLAQIVVVDDHSDAPATVYQLPRVHIHRNSENKGYIASVNVGMALMQTDIVIVLDCDARPLTPIAAPVLAEFESNPQLGALGFMQTDHTQNLRPAAELTPTLREFIIGPAFFSRLPQFIKSKLLPQDRSLCIHSCCMAIRREAFQQVGGFDESFDFLDGDMDFSWCLLEHGWKNAISDQVLCFHPGSGSPQTTERRVIRHHQNRTRLLKKHQHWPSSPLVHFGLIGRHLCECGALSLLSTLPGQSHYRSKLSTRLKLLRSASSDYQHSLT